MDRRSTLGDKLARGDNLTREDDDPVNDLGDPSFGWDKLRLVYDVVHFSSIGPDGKYRVPLTYTK